MRLFRSYRARLQAAFVGLGFVATALTGWQASRSASDALRVATFEHLNAIRETRALRLERFFHEAREHLAALAANAITAVALDDFRAGLERLPEADGSSPRRAALRKHYEALLDPLADTEGELAAPERWLPRDGRVVTLQSIFMVENEHPARAKDLLLSAPESSAYADAHVKYHPTFHRYAAAFGLYDIFLIDAVSAQVVYSVLKEFDLGMHLTDPAYREVGLGRAFTRAMRSSSHGAVVCEDYQGYAPSGFAPAAFLAAPVWHGGVKVGVIAVQVSIDEVNRVMTAQGRWREEGLGTTGHAYILAENGTLRSDVRFELDDPER